MLRKLEKSSKFCLFTILCVLFLAFEGCIFFLPLPAPTQYKNYQSRTKLNLPFEGEWYVYWGGMKKSQNYHVTSSHQRFAYDFVRVRKGEPLKRDVLRAGQSYEGNIKANENHYAYGEAVLSPADGIVVNMNDGVRDNTPRQTNPVNLFGNYIIIDHGFDEFSLLGHLQNGSVAVKIGDKVKSGQFLALCGNSGNSTDPHLHYHLQNTPYVKRSKGLPAQFHDYILDGKEIAQGSPIRGQKIKSKKSLNLVD